MGKGGKRNESYVSFPDAKSVNSVFHRRFLWIKLPNIFIERHVLELVRVE